MRNSLLLALVLLLVAGCSQKSSNKQDKGSDEVHIGKYVYLDNREVLHLRTGCKAVFKVQNMQQVNPVEPMCLSFDALNWVCSQCVTEQDIDSLKKIFGEYRQSYNNVGDLYEDLISKNYDLPSEQQFRKDMREEALVRAVYQTLLNEKANIPTIDEFFQWIGLGKPAKRKQNNELKDSITADYTDILYEDLKSHGYLEKGRGHFRSFFLAPGRQGYKNRKALYEDLRSQGYFDSKNYEEFVKRIGLHVNPAIDNKNN